MCYIANMNRANRYAAAAIAFLTLAALGCESETDRATNEAAVAYFAAEAVIKVAAPEEFAAWEAARAKRDKVFEAAAAETVDRINAGKPGNFGEVLEATPGHESADAEYKTASIVLEAAAPEEYEPFMTAFRTALDLLRK